MTKVSVVIPTYNRAHFIAESIQSVLNQTFADFELIVVDDGSTDNTKEVVESFQDTRIRYIYQTNHGVSSARNTGIKASCGEYVAFLDSDDMWLPENLGLKVKQLNYCTDIALVCSDFYYYDNSTGVILGRDWHSKRFFKSFNSKKASSCALRYLLHKGCFIWTPASVLRRTVFTEVGYFDESLRTHEDWDLAVRIVLRFPIVTIDTPLVFYRTNGDASLTSNMERTYQGDLLVLDKALRSFPLDKTHLRLVKRRLARAHFRYGRSMVTNGMIDLGQKALLAAIKVNSWCVRPYIYLAGSILGSRVILTLKSLKKRLGHKFAWSQSSGETLKNLLGKNYIANKKDK